MQTQRRLSQFRQRGAPNESSASCDILFNFPGQRGLSREETKSYRSVREQEKHSVGTNHGGSFLTDVTDLPHNFENWWNKIIRQDSSDTDHEQLDK